jgi:hypothetical protein
MAIATKEIRAIVFDVSGHGLGHLGQTAPVIQKLSAQYPAARIIVRSTQPAPVVRDFVGGRVEFDTPPPEATLVMRGPTVVDAAASAAAYGALHANWHEHLAREAARLAALAPAALVANIPYLSLAAAKRIGIPAIAMCSLNWLDLYRAYCGEAPDAPAILETLATAYRSADIFLQPRPHMPMSDLPNRRSIGPIARIGRRRDNEIRTALQLSQRTRLVLVTLGGIPSEQRLRLPDMPDVHWLVASDQTQASTRATDISQLAVGFIDVLASCDAVVTKVGYGTFVEAACNGIAVVSAARPDWPESEFLIDWETRNANFTLAEGGIESANGLRTAVAAVLEHPRKTPPPPSGIAEAADVIARLAGL